MKKIFTLFTACLLIACFFASSVNAQTISSFSPSNGAVGSSVTISGSGFNTTAANDVVFFGATKATVTAASATSLTVTVPGGALYAPITVINTATNLSAQSRLNFSPLFSPSKSTLATNDFNTVVGVAAQGPFKIIAADLDNDGFTDIVCASHNGQPMTIHRNTLTSAGATITSASFPSYFTLGVANPNCLAIGDIDGDGKLDIVTRNTGGSTIYVYRRNSNALGSSGFDTYSFNAGENTGSWGGITIGDVNGDGKPEIIFANNSSVGILQNTSSGAGSINFNNVVLLPIGNDNGEVVINDIDGDGKPDIAVACGGTGSSANYAAVFQNINNSGTITTGSFATAVTYATGTGQSGNMAIRVTDLDGDGKPEMLLTGWFTQTLEVFPNTSSSGLINAGSFGTRVDFPMTQFSNDLTVADFNGDGKPDVAALGQTDIRLFNNTNTTTGGFSSSSLAASISLTMYGSGGTPYGLEIGDFNNDGRIDLAGVNDYNGNISILQNNPCVANTISLSSAAGTNAQAACVNTPITSITYNTTGATSASFSGLPTGVSGTWSANVVTISGTPTANGTYSYTVSLPGGCTTVTANGTITVNSTPTATITASGPTTFCSNSSVTLTASSGSSYLWSTGSVSPSIITSAGGSYSVTVTNAAGCSAKSSPTVVTVNQTPIISGVLGTLTICNGTTTQLNLASASGGTISFSGGYEIHTFTNGGTFTPFFTGNVDVLVVAGGGAGGGTSGPTGGGHYNGGGGGAGGLLQTTGYAVTLNNSIPVTVGAGGASVTSGIGNNGQNSVFGTITTIGGGGGGQYGGVGNNGGSGGGNGRDNNATPAQGTAGQGNAGGNGDSGGGGGAGAAASGINGGAGLSSTLSGSTVFYAGGGGGSGAATPGGAGGVGGGGNGSNSFVYQVPGTSATPNTGGGGGAAGVGFATGAGGSGIVIVRFPSPITTTWSSSNTSVATIANSGLLTGANAGTSIITGLATNATGCTSSASSTVTVNPLPTATISGTTAVCLNGTSPTITFTGANATAPYTFTYTLNNGAQQTITSVANSATITVSTATAGTFTYALVSVKDASSTLCSNPATGSAVVTVNPLPTASISGTTTVCQNASSPNITFTGANGTSPYTFTYTINAGTPQTVTSTGNTATVPVPTGTSGTFVYALTSVKDASSTLCTNTAAGSATVTVNGLPTIAITPSSPSIVNGNSVTLTASGASSYAWSPSTGLSATTGASVSANPNVTTTYTVTGTNANTCVNTGSVTVTVTYVSAGGLNFDGSNDYVSLNNTVGNVGSGDFTVEMDIRSNLASTSYLFSKRSFCGGDNFISMQIVGGKLSIELEQDASGTQYLGLTGTTTINDNAWHHVAMTRKSGVVTLYVDGVANGTGNSTANINNSYVTTLGASVCNGQNGSVLYRGDMDEVRVWNRALCQAELNNNRTCELVLPQTGLQVYYKLNAGNINANNAGVTTATDASGNGYDGTLNNFALIGTTSNWVAGTVSGSCSTFTPPTASITGTTSVCTGATTTLSNTNPGVWSSSNTGVATINSSGVVTGVSAGTTVITFTNNCGGVSTTTVTVSASPVASITALGPTSFCAGGSVTLTASSSSSYAWSNGATTQSTTVFASGSYTVTVSSGTCSSTSAATVVTVNTAPVVSPIGGVSNIEVLAVGGGGGAGGPDGTLGAGGGAGGAVYAAYTLNSLNNVYTVAVGGAGNGGTGCNPSSPGGTGGTNGGGTGGNAGTGGCSGGGGGGGGWSGLYQLANYFVVAGGGAGGGGSNEGTANDVTTPGGGTQSAANGSSMTGGNGTTYSGDGGGGGAGGGGYLGGAGQSQLNATGQIASQAYGGTNYISPTNLSAFAAYSGTSGATAGGGSGGGAAVTVANAANFGYANNYGVGGTGQGNGTTSAAGAGTQGIVIIRYPGLPAATGGTITQSGGYTIHTFTNPGNNTFTVNSVSSICVGSSVTLSSATPGGVWSSSNGTVAAVNGSGLVTGVSAGTVTISYTVTNASNCSTTVTATVTVNPLPTATISGTTTVCQNSSAPTITLTGANATSPYTFVYTVNGGAQQTITSTGSTATINVPTTTAGTFTYTLVSVKDASSTLCSNSATGSATVTVNPLPTATISGTTAVCQNAATPTITFTGSNATSPYTFTYTINSGTQQTVTSSGNTATVNVPTGTAGTFVYALVSVKDASSTLCSNTASGSATVTVNPLPTATISGTMAVCQNAANPTITFSGANGTTPYTFTYTINSGAPQTATSSGTTATVTVPTGTTGTFTYALVSVKDASSTLCSNTAGGSATVTVNPLPTATISGTTSVCQNATQPTITFTGANGTSPYTFTYTINNGTQQTVASSGNTATVNAPTGTAGTFSYALVSVKDASATICSATATGSATVTVNALPVPVLAASGPTTFCANSSVTLSVQGSGSGNALTFSSGKYVDVPTNSSLSVGTSTDFTYEAWAKLNGSQSNYAGIVIKGSGGPFVQLVIVNNNIAAEIYSSSLVGTGAGLEGSTNLNDGNWHHLAMVVSRSSNNCKLYVDGNLEANVTNSLFSGNLDNAYDLLIGVERGKSIFFNGSIDEVRIWNTARTQAQLQASKNNVVPTNSTGLVAYYKLDEGSGSVTADATANAHSGNLIGSPVWLVPSTAPIVGYANFNWSNGATTAAISPVSSGGYTVTVTDASGCVNTSAPINITINPLPTATISGTTTVCQNAAAPTITFTGANATSPYTFTYSINSVTQPTITSTGNTATVSAPTGAAGTFTYTLISVKDASGTACTNTASGSAVVTVNSAPVFTVCPANQSATNGASQCNAVVSYTATATGSPVPALTYTFSGATTGSGSGTGSGQTFNVGVTVVTITVTNTCGFANCSFTVTVLDVTAPSIVCAANITQNTDPNLCTANVTVTAPTVSDNCGAAGTNVLNFDGLNDYVSIAHNNILEPASFTAEAWVYPTGGGGLQYRCVFGKRTPSNGWNLFINSANGLELWNGWSQVINGPVIPLNAWTHLAVTENGSGQRLYVNGVLVGSTGANYSPSGAAASFALGVNSDGFAPWFFGGSMKDIRFWNVAKTAAQITAGMSGSISTPQSNLIFNFPANQGTGGGNNSGITTLNDLSGNNLNGTFVNFAMTGNTSNFIPDPAAASTLTVTNSFNGTSNASGTYPLGTTTIVWTAHDLAGNTSTCNQTVTVVDNTPPTISCPSNISVIATSAAGAAVNYTAPIGTDNCSGATTVRTAGLASGSTFAIGTTTVTHTVTDGAGLTAQCSFTVTVSGLAPAIVCPSNITVNNAAGQCGANVNFAATETTGIPASTITYAPASGSFFPVGTTTVTATATNAVGSSSCSFTVTVLDVTPPTIICPANISVSTASNKCAATIAITNATATDNCSVATITGTRSDGLALTADYPSGPTTIVWVAKDAAGNTSTCNQLVTVTDNVAPTVVTKNITVNLDASGNASITAAQIDNGSTDNCGVSSISVSPNSFNCSNVTNAVNNAGNALFFNGGSIDVPHDASIAPLNAWTIETWVKTSVSNVQHSLIEKYSCDGSQYGYLLRITSSNQLLAFALAGCGGGNVTGSTVLAPNTWYHVAATFNRTTGVLKVYVNGVLDGTATGISTPTIPSTLPLRIGSRGNDAGTKLQGWLDEVRVWDVERSAAQILAAKGIKLTGTESGLQAYYSFDEALASTTITDGATLTVANNATIPSGVSRVVSTAPIGSAGTQVTLTVTDINGNIATGNASVTVVDNIAPVFTACPANQTLIATSAAGATATYATPTATDNCSAVVARTSGLASGSTFPIGTTTVTHTATDPSGNSVTCSFTVTVSGLAPSINCPANITVNNTSGQCGANVSFTATESTGIPASTITYSIAPGSFFGTGTQAVTATATNAVGVSNCTFYVTVNDAEKPVITCPPNQFVNLDASCNATLPDYRSLLTVSDNCTPVGSLVITQSPAGGTVVSTKGAVIVTFTVTDAAGNSNTCNISVDKRDVTAPVITCPSPIATTNNTNVCGAVVTYSTPTATDNCSGSAFNFFNAGEPNNYGGNEDYLQLFNSGTWNDLPAGNSNNFIVEFNSVISTSFSGYTRIGVFGGHTYYISTFTQSWPNARSSAISIGGDLASINTLAEDQFLSPYGGNVWVGGYQDHSDPSYVEPGNASQNFGGWKWVDGTKLGAGQITITQIAGLPSGSTFPIGVTTNTYQATDESGNSSTCSFTVTVTDNQKPALACPSNITHTADAGQCSYSFTPSTPSATDNCPGVTVAGVRSDALALSAPYPVGTTTITWTATDAYSNTTICTQTITVTDNEKPVLTCSANVTHTADAGLCSYSFTPNTPMASDNCTAVTVAGVRSDAQGLSAPYPVGITTITWTATDSHGNSINCIQTVTVSDDENPVITCSANVTHTADGGLCSYSFTPATPVATDNCPGVTVTGVRSDALALNAPYPVGGTTITWTATDVHAHSVSCTQTVTVTDNEKPTITAAPDQTQTADAGDCGAIVTVASPVSTHDNCGVLSVINSYTGTSSANAHYPVGTTTITWTVTDIHGNTQTATQNITITDNEKPVIHNLPANITVNALNNNCSNLVSWTKPTATDNCAIASFVSSDPLYETLGFTLLSVGVNTITYTATDIHGNSTTASFTITVVDNQPPIITGCPSNITVNAATGRCDNVVNWNPPTASDNCPGVSLSTNHISGETFPVGVTTVTYTATDHAGLTTICSFTVTVVDAQKPILTGVPANVTVECNAVPAPVTVTATDNCTSYVPVLYTETRTDGSCPNSYTLTRVWSATDAAGNTGSGTQVITVQDTQAPVLSAAPANTTVECDAVPAPATLTATDNCSTPIVTYTETRTDGSCPNSYTLTRVWTATDACGNASSKTQIITVLDRTAPVLSGVPANITVACDAVPVAAIVTATDNCDASPVVGYAETMTSSACPGNYLLTRVWTAIDACGNSSSQTQVITVQDTKAPVLSAAPADTTVQCDAVPAPATLTATDNCDASPFVIYAQTRTNGNCPNNYTLTRVWTGIDACGNTSSKTQVITVIDTQAPVLSAAPANTTVECDAVPAPATLTATDNCSTPTVTYTQTRTDGTCPSSYTLIRTWTATDACGNASSVRQVITVLDRTAPVLSAAPADATVECDAVPTPATLTAIDNCDAAPVVTYTQTRTDGTSVNDYTLTRTWTATDACGNTSFKTQTITVHDTKAPVLTVPSAISVNTDNNVCGATVGFTATATDNCGPVTITYSKNPGTVFATGATVVTVTAKDASGNTTVNTFTVTVTDRQPATVVTKNITIPLSASGSASIAATDVNNGSSDACGIATMSVSPNNFTCANVGANTVTLTVTDVNGNTSSKTATVTVIDNIAPTVVTQNISVSLGSNGTVSITPAQINNGSTDNCSIATYTLDKTNFTCANVGANTVTLTVTDVNGNVSSKTATVTVIDNIAPTVVTQNISVSLGSNGTVSITPAQINNGSTDNCSIATYTLDKTNFTCANVGANTVTLTVTDVNGNISSKTATVTVIDNIAPTVVTQNITVALAANGSVSITPAQINSGSTDNCSIATYTLDKTSFTCANVGANTVTLTVIDVNGNTSSKTATVTVIDNIAPTVITQNISVSLGSNGTVSITPAQINSGSTDNCSIATYTLDKTSFTCANVGANTVTLTVVDVNGNTSSKTATVTVVDNIAPTVVTQNISVSLGSNGTVSITPAQINSGSTDNCSIATYTLDKTNFTCANVGANTVTLTVVDVNGNTSSKTATVTVVDNIAPTVVTQNISVSLGSNGTVSITPAQINSGSTDNCSIATYTLDKTSFTCANVGANTVTLTVTDVNGNTSSKTATVTVIDNIAPTVVTQNITVALAANGSVSITPAQINSGSTDNCSIATYTLDKTSFTCANVGANTVTLTVVDVNGNTSSKTATVTVVDNIAPTVITKNISVSLGTNGTVSITPSQINNGSTDNCSIASYTLDKTSFNCANVGANTVTLTVIDVNGNTSSKTATVTVVDNIAPIVITQNITVNLGTNGTVSITPAQINNGSTDNCSIASYTLDKTSFTCANVGNNTVTLTVTDVNGNVSTGTAVVTVQDNTAPVVLTQNITVALGSNGTVSITPAQINNGSTDACGIKTITVSPNSFTCANVGANTVTLTVTDVNGNTSTGTAVVTVQDNIAPTAITKNITVALNGSGQATVTPAQVDNGSNDNCSVALSFQCASAGGQNLFSNGDLTSGYTGWTVSNVDNSGGWKATGGNPTGYYLLNSNGAAATDPTIQQTVTGLVPGQWYTISGQRNNIENGAFGNASALSFGVAVDNTVILQLANTGGATWIPFSVQFKATATSHVISFSAERNGDDTQYGVDNLSVVATPPASCATSSIVFNCSNIGVNTVKLVVTDPSGNTATQTATVTVVDNLAPVLSVPSNATVNCGTSTAPSATGTATATDNCGTATVTYSDVTTGNVITRTWKAVDAYSNTATATQTITIVDNIKPVVVNPADITVTCSTLTSPSITGTATATDNCGIPTVTYSDVWYNSTTLLRFWKATDGFGNVSNVINAQTILINDNIKPVITDVPDITVNCGASTLPSATGTATATDNCGTPTVTYSDVTSGNVITRTWKATDGFGNTATSTQVITVGAVFTATVSSVPTSSTYTGGVSTNLYLGYGAQSTTLQMGSLPSAGAPYTYLWSGSYTNKLSSTTAASPVFTPSTFGYYTFSVTVTNKYGCTSTATISICVTDIRVAGTSGITAQVYVCHVTNVLGHTTYTTLQVLTSILSVYVNSSCGDRLGSCSQSACNTTVANSIVGNNSGITKEGGTEVSTSNDELKVTVMPNPTNTFFTLKLESKYEIPVNMRVMDANGRVIDAKSKIGANSTIQIGHNYSSGTYYAELIQGTQRKVVQMIKGR